MTAENQRAARPIFRRAAAVVAIVCAVLAVVFGVAGGDVRWLGVGVCIVVAIIMAAIATTGNWPPRRAGRA